ncbi:MAG TPA: Ig-like domain-containing protein [Lachnospiraceae bacterium]|nr:Ig-like domain-containing protein [Lachnospiraceae bacterium]
MKKKGIAFITVLTLVIALLGVIPNQQVNAAEVSIPNSAKEFNNHSYMVYDQSITWEEAKTYCEKLGGHLATITTQAEQTFISGLVVEKTRSYWLGAQIVNNSWVWITNEKFNFTDWSIGEPNGGDNNMYLQCYSSGKWDDTYLTGNGNDVSDDMHGFICEWDSLKQYLNLSDNTLVIYTGYSSSLEYNVGPKQVVTFTSDDIKTVTVDNNGNIMAIKNGTAVITATAEDGQTKDCLVIVISEPTRVKLNSSKVTIKKGGKFTFIATVYPTESSKYETVTWSSNNKAIATVNSKGVIKSRKAGVCTITATTSNGIKATCKVIVK